MKRIRVKWAIWSLVVVVLAVATGFLLRPVSYFRGAEYLRETFSGVESHSVQVAGHRVHYLAEGPAGGPVVVLVHGLGGHAEDWLNLAPFLAHAGYRVYMPDLIGYGRSDQPTDFTYSVRNEAAVVTGFFDAMGLQQVRLGGWSMGGWIVELVAAEHPERVSRLVVFDAAGLYIRPTWDPALFTPQTAGQLDELEALLMPDPKPVPGFVARDILRVTRRDGWVVKRAIDTMRTGQDTTDNLLPRLKMPVLIEWGALDHITPPNQAQIIHRLVPQSQLDIIDGCGHLAPAQCTAQMGPHVVGFLQQ
jgi:pimeloyl-ACP methyl ester carboxylesterase